MFISLTYYSLTLIHSFNYSQLLIMAEEKQHMLLELLESNGIQNIDTNVFTEIDNIKDEIKLREDYGVIIYDYENKTITLGIQTDCEDEPDLSIFDDVYNIFDEFGDLECPEYPSGYLKGRETPTPGIIYKTLRAFFDRNFVNDVNRPFVGDNEKILYITYADIKKDYIELRYNTLTNLEVKQHRMNYYTSNPEGTFLDYRKDIDSYVVMSYSALVLLQSVLKK